MEFLIARGSPPSYAHPSHRAADFPRGLAAMAGTAEQAVDNTLANPSLHTTPSVSSQPD
jgi:hypothetical protein